jgi:hypothetical protein
MVPIHGRRLEAESPLFCAADVAELAAMVAGTGLNANSHLCQRPTW